MLSRGSLKGVDSSRKEIAKAERAHLRQLKKRKKDDLEAFMKKQNDEIDADSVRCALGPNGFWEARAMPAQSNAASV